jgi:translation initiation factor IF-2
LWDTIKVHTTTAHSLQELKDSISKKAANISKQEIGHVTCNISEGATPTYKPEVKILRFL